MTGLLSRAAVESDLYAMLDTRSGPASALYLDVVALPGPLQAGLQVGRAVLAILAEPLEVAGARLQIASGVGPAVAEGPQLRDRSG